LSSLSNLYCGWLLGWELLSRWMSHLLMVMHSYVEIDLQLQTSLLLHLVGQWSFLQSTSCVSFFFAALHFSHHFVFIPTMHQYHEFVGNSCACLLA
jgi:hypothetical protein